MWLSCVVHYALTVMLDVYMHSDQSGEVDWNTLGNILTAHLMAEVCTVTVRVHHDCMLFCSYFCTGLMCFIC